MINSTDPANSGDAANLTNSIKPTSDKRSVALLDDDELFVQTLSRRLGQKGIKSTPFTCLAALKSTQDRFTHLVLDMNLGNESVLHSLEELRARWPQAGILLLTGYGSIATAVLAMKKGADQYLTKPLNLSELINHLNSGYTADHGVDNASVQAQQNVEDFQVLTPAQLQWEQIQSVFHKNNGNVSATARELNMHRRTLQRKLQKKPRT